MSQFAEFIPDVPEDFQALYYNYNGIRSLLRPMWTQTVFFEFFWSELNSQITSNKIRQLEIKRSNEDRIVTTTTRAFTGVHGNLLELDHSLRKDGQTPLLMTCGTLSRRNYIAFDSTLAMLRSVCAAQDAGILRYQKERVGSKEAGDIIYDPKELWDVIRPFNPRAEYWPALIAGTVDFDSIHFELPANGIFPKDPEMSSLVFGDPEDYYRAADKALRPAGLGEDTLPPAPKG